MPSPIAHSISGYVLSQGLIHRERALFKHSIFTSPLVVLYAVAIANVPDLDFLPQWILGLDSHRGPTHSLGQALLWSLVFSLIAMALRRSLFKPILLLTFALYGSHLLLDVFTSGGDGLPLLWPLSDVSFHSPISLFPAVHHSRGLFDPSHFVFITFELLYSVGLLWGLKRWKHRLRPTLFGGPPE